MTNVLQLVVLFILFCASLFTLAGCAGFEPVEKGGPAGPAAEPSPKPVELVAYFELLDRMAPGDVLRQSTELAAAQTTAQQTPTSTNRLRYAIALGAAGHTLSNPVEARRLITELLAGTNDLTALETSLANALMREFDARVALYAELARQREDSERQIKAIDAEGDRRYSALNAETQRLKKSLAEAERKLEAVAEMERSLTPESN